MVSEEKRRVLDMLSAGKIDVSEAEKLLSALEEEVEVEKQFKGEAKHLRIKVDEEGENKVNINIPLSIAKVVMNFISDSVKKKLREKNIDLDEVIQQIENAETTQKIVEVQDDGDKVEIYLE
ncbi:SHOCT-like domain-containing protein [Fuchsiella alkaliacetigena]|uniref:SHOCT-like domain-containing protein n=1 Tax=Fuchsiella alkaliacetigena TaxID=957042 RepID=UPI00200AF228|nr:hypothetical protein [Fuchsiella alkaliacetigena]MCK8823803.1 hypothetical protein [Fuchsiella alkaliacetigena]